MKNLKLKITTKPKRKTGGIILGILLVIFAGWNFIDGYMKSHQAGMLLAPIVCLVLGVIAILISVKKRSESVYEFKDIENYELEQTILP